MNSQFCLLLFCVFFYLTSCDDTSSDNSSNDTGTTTQTSQISFDASNPLFKELESSQTGVTFNNQMEINSLKSPMLYINIFNGGGLGAGDINNDGLVDLYFTGNQVDNKLYLNKGNFEFEDITERAGVACQDSWSTGVTMSDVNGDGFMDMYVCRAYYDEPEKRVNKLFINNGDLTFSDKTQDFGLVKPDYSITATFFDYDKDGDPDLFVGNHPLDRTKTSYADHIKKWKAPKLEWSDRLYRNDGGRFTEVTKEAGVLSYGWTLGVVSADLNQDGWQDLFLSIDHTEPDRYYLNNQDGTFSEVSEEYLKHMSHSSMGVDAADINNDGLLDLAVVEMLAISNFDEKTKMNSMNPERFWIFVDNGYNYQYMRNMMHLGSGKGQFSEIGQMAGIERTNWSWASLLADFDNDGWKDFYVSNGYYRNYTDKDHHKVYLKAFEEADKVGKPKSEVMLEYGRTAPSTKRKNNFFRNNRDLTFTEMGAEFGVDFLGFSSGAIYADLDNDGDLDLVVNNTDDPASIYQNQVRERGGNNFLRVKLDHPNTVFPVGTKVTIETKDGMQFQEFAYVRGYQSSVEGTIHFGLGQESKVKNLNIWWPDGKVQTLNDIAANQVLTLKHAEAVPEGNSTNNNASLFAEVTESTGIDHSHEETIFDDFQRQVLLPHKMSQFGPFFTSADIDRNGLEDFYAGGGNGQAGALFLQTAVGKFEKQEIESFNADKNHEDMGAAFVDVNNDGFVDLYVASGGNEFKEDSEMLQDRLYINVGKDQGYLRKVKNAIPVATNSSSCVKPFDFDGDGDMDLFVGGRQVPGKYPSPANSMLLENNNGKFIDATTSRAPGLEGLGMVTDAAWTDFDGDGTPDLVIVGEWMPVTVFKQTAGKFENATAQFGLEGTGGWWNRIAQGDLDNDGDLDFVLGNLGLNYKYAASPEKPFHVYASDFDESGTFDIALGYFLENDVLYPVRGRQCSSEQVPSIAEKFPTYADYGQASIFEVYGDGLESAIHYEVTEFKSSVMLNKGNGNYDFLALPNQAQIAPINGIILRDFDKDGKLDALVAGNLFVSEVETGRADSGKGLFLKGLGNGAFKAATATESGLDLSGDVKDIHPIKQGNTGSEIILVGNNNDDLKIIQWTGGSGQQLSSLQ